MIMALASPFTQPQGMSMSLDQQRLMISQDYRRSGYNVCWLQGGFCVKAQQYPDHLYQSTFLGGSNDDRGERIAIHPTSGDIYVTGYTYSNDFQRLLEGHKRRSQAFLTPLYQDSTAL